MPFAEVNRSRTLCRFSALTVAALCLAVVLPRQTVCAAGPAAGGGTRRVGKVPSHTSQDSGPATTPVLVELFTSEGCASCPTADALLARLEREQPIASADILALEEHVDYWNSPDWRDRFSSSQFSARQDVYVRRLLLNSEYTPEMVVDGTDEFSGNDIIHAFRAVAQAARTPKLALRLSPLEDDGGRLAGKVSLARRRVADKADVYAAVVESVVSTQVLGGDNGGRTLHHVSVVRAMQRIGTLARLAVAPLKFSLAVPGDTSPENLRVVVFAQRAGQGAVLGAVSSPPVGGPRRPAPIAIEPAAGQ